MVCLAEGSEKQELKSIVFSRSFMHTASAKEFVLSLLEQGAEVIHSEVSLDIEGEGRPEPILAFRLNDDIFVEGFGIPGCLALTISKYNPDNQTFVHIA
jgi:hypothetical protein